MYCIVVSNSLNCGLNVFLYVSYKIFDPFIIFRLSSWTSVVYSNDTSVPMPKYITQTRISYGMCWNEHTPFYAACVRTRQLQGHWKHSLL